MSDRDRIYLLYFETLTGSISAEDQLFVEKALLENEQFQQIWASLENESLNIPIGDFADNVDEKAALSDLKNTVKGQRMPRTAETTEQGIGSKDVNLKIKDDIGDKEQVFSLFTTKLEKKDVLTEPLVDNGQIQKKKRGFVMRWAAIFIVILGLSGIWYWMNRNATITDSRQIAALIQKDKKEVELQLASGRKVTIVNDQALKQIKVNGGAIALNMDSLSIKADDTAQNLLVVPSGRFYHITLGDGTKVTLNASTTLRFPFRFSGATREVFVDGEAYFSVSKDAAHPFIVHTPQTSIKVLGTKFNVNSYNPTVVKASLIEGRIVTKANNSTKAPIILQPGREASFGANRGFEVHSFDTEDVLSWLNGVYYFHNLTIDQLSKIISRNYGVAVFVENPEIENRSVTGMMDRKKLTELLSDLSVTAGVNSYFKNNRLYLK